MKKIVLGCAAVLLSLGLLAGCNNEEEETEPGPVVENPDSGNDGGDEETWSVHATGRLGVLYPSSYHYLYFTGTVSEGYKGDCSTDFEEGVEVTLMTSSKGAATVSYTLDGVEYWLGGYYEGSYYDLERYTEVQYLTWDANNNAILSADGEYYLGTWDGHSECIRWLEKSYLGTTTEPAAEVFSVAQENPEAPRVDGIENLGSSGNEQYPVALSYAHTLTTNDKGSTSAETTSVEMGGLTWSFGKAPYWGFDNYSGRGVQIGSSGAGSANGVTISTSFTETVYVAALSLELATVSGATATVVTTTDSTTLQTATVSKTTLDTFSDCEAAAGDDLTITFTGDLSTNDGAAGSGKAVYIASIEFTLYVTSNSSLIPEE